MLLDLNAYLISSCHAGPWQVYQLRSLFPKLIGNRKIKFDQENRKHFSGLTVLAFPQTWTWNVMRNDGKGKGSNRREAGASSSLRLICPLHTHAGWNLPSLCSLKCVNIKRIAWIDCNSSCKRQPNVCCPTCVCIMARSTLRELPLSSLVLKHNDVTSTAQNFGWESKHCVRRRDEKHHLRIFTLKSFCNTFPLMWKKKA